jgi:hypothetical protein
MAAEKRDTLKIMKTVPDIVRTKSKEDVRARTETVTIATTTANTLIASNGCRAIPVEVGAETTTTMEIDAKRTTMGDDETRENPSVVVGTLPRSQVTSHHPRHLRHLHHRTDIHDDHMIADNPPPLAVGAGLSLVLYEMFDGLRNFDREQ